MQDQDSEGPRPETVQPNGVTIDPAALPGTFPPIFDLSNLSFPTHWDGYLQTQTQKVFRLGAWDPKYFDHAVRDATLYLETRIRELCDAPAELIGVKLMEFAFKHDEPRGHLICASVNDAEAQGLHSLFRGAILQIRNPLGHREMNMRPEEALDSIAFISYLLRLANESAAEKYIFPFLPRREKWRGIQLTRWVDIDGDGVKEFVVVLGERKFGLNAGGEGRVLILHNDLRSVVPGRVPLLANAYYTPHIAIGDLDDDGRPEIVVSLTLENTRTKRGVVIDFHEGSLRAADEVSGKPLVSQVWPFEILTLASTKSETVVARYADDNSVEYLSYIDGELVPWEHVFSFS